MGGQGHADPSLLSANTPGASQEFRAKFINVSGWCTWGDALDKMTPTGMVEGRGPRREVLEQLEKLITEPLTPLLRQHVAAMRLKGEKNHCCFFDVSGGYAEEIAGIWNAWMRNPGNRLAFNGMQLRAVAEQPLETQMRQRAMGAATDFLKARLDPGSELKSRWKGTWKVYARFQGQDESAWKLMAHVVSVGAIQWGEPCNLQAHGGLPNAEECQRALANFSRD